MWGTLASAWCPGFHLWSPAGHNPMKRRGSPWLPPTSQSGPCSTPPLLRQLLGAVAVRLFVPVMVATLEPVGGLHVLIIYCMFCIYWVLVCGRRWVVSDCHLKLLFPSPPCGLAHNGNLIGGGSERVEEVMGLPLLWEILQSTSPAICPVELFVTVSPCHLVPFIFRQARYCSHNPSMPLGFVRTDWVNFDLFFT